MKQVILGTAGHIDHGKTSLIKALTGIDTDRLKEEKRRGITIELGFAHMDLPGGERLGIVDVPGHERFVRHMVAGATGMDLVALMIAADEGVMPQTREHLEICQLLQVKRGLVILTKVDLVEDPDWLELVREEIAEFLQGTFLEGAPMFAVSARTGVGLDELRQGLAQLVEQVEPRSAGGPFRLCVDRVFTMRGFGTVVTGTSISGHVQIGDTVVIYPQGQKAKVRGLQVHNLEVQEVLPGQRTAVNLQSLERALIRRGDVVASPNALLAGHMLDVHVELLPDAPRPVKTRAKVRFHTGTSEHLASFIPLGVAELKPGERCFAQLRFEEPIAVLRGDRFVLRSYSPMITIGGGTVLHPLPKKHKGRDKTAAAEALRTLLDGDEPQTIVWHAHDAGWNGLSESELQIRANLFGKSFDKTLQQLISQKKIVLYDRDQRRYLHPEYLESLEETILASLGQYHERFPLKEGMPKEALAARLPKLVDAKLFNYVLQQLSQRGQVEALKEWVHLASHKVSLKPDEERIRDRISEIYRTSALQPPYFKDVARDLPGSPTQHREVLAWMCSQGAMIKVKEDLYFDAGALSDLKQRVVAYLKEHGQIGPPEFKELTGASRKYSIPLLEHLDEQKVTIRVGDMRQLRDSTAESG